MNNPNIIGGGWMKRLRSRWRLRYGRCPCCNVRFPDRFTSDGQRYCWLCFITCSLIYTECGDVREPY